MPGYLLEGRFFFSAVHKRPTREENFTNFFVHFLIKYNIITTQIQCSLERNRWPFHDIFNESVKKIVIYTNINTEQA